MSKLCISYIPKVKGESLDFRITEVLKKCMRYYSKKNNILSSPGYLSKPRYIDNFVQEFKNIVPGDEKVYIGYFYGIGNQYKGISLIDEHYKELVKTGKFNKLNVDFSHQTDHRKMMFFFEIKEEPEFMFEYEILNKTNLEKFLSSIIVNAVLIGSSNQSYTTYYGGASRKADKGEADVLMFATDDNNRVIRENMYVEGTVIYEQICGIGNTEPHDYLKGILREFLSKALI